MKGCLFFNRIIPVGIVLFLGGCQACTEQHDPTADNERFKNERLTANKPIERLTASGEIPIKEDPVSVATSSGGTPGEIKYQQLCVACHDADGSASGPAAQALNPKPRDLTDASWQDAVDDARIAKVIKLGGVSVGLSPTMAPWGQMISDDEIQDIVKLIRTMKKN